MKRFKIAPEIHYEKDAVHYLENIEGKRAFIVTDEVLLNIGLVDKVKTILAQQGITCEIFYGVEPDPSFETVTNGLEKFINSQSDTLIALGGGSVIDASKAMIYFSKHIGKTSSGVNDNHTPYFIVIPTTSGTGSEVTSYTVLTDTKKSTKIAIQGDEMLPDLALLDCELVKTVPPSVTADTGLDALAHAVEAFVSKHASDYTDAFAQMAIEFIFQYLVNCYKNGADQLSREKIHNASCLAGMAFENSSLGLNHSLAHVFGARFKVPHGKANAIFLPYTIKYNSGLFDDNDHIDFAAAHKYVKLAKLLDLPASDLKEGVVMLSKSIKVLNTQLNIPLTIKELGIDADEFTASLKEMSAIAFHDICTAGNPRVPTEEEIYRLFQEAFYGKKICKEESV